MSQEEIKQTFEVTSPANLIVKNIRGNVNITKGAVDQIEVHSIKHLDSGDPDYTEVILEQSTDNTVKVIAEYDKGGILNLHQPSKVDFTITVPEECNLTVKTVSANIFASGINGEISLKSVSGKISFSMLSGTLNFDSVSGKIEGSAAIGNAKFKSVSGKVDITDSQLTDFSATTVSGRIDIQSSLAEGPYQLKSVSGKCVFIIPEESACSLKAKSVSGSFRTNMPATDLFSSRRKWEAEFFGGTGPSISISTVSGSLVLATSLEDLKTPAIKQQSEEERLDILNQIKNGELEVDAAIEQLI